MVDFIRERIGRECRRSRPGNAEGSENEHAERAGQRDGLKIFEFLNVLCKGIVSTLVIIIQLPAKLAAPLAGISGLVPFFAEVLGNEWTVHFKREDDDALSQGAKRQGNGGEYGKNRLHDQGAIGDRFGRTERARRVTSSKRRCRRQSSVRDTARTMGAQRGTFPERQLPFSVAAFRMRNACCAWSSVGGLEPRLLRIHAAGNRSIECPAPAEAGNP